MESSFKARGRFERASFVRHLAICLAAAIAYVQRERLRPTSNTLWIIGITMIVNLAITVLPDRPKWTRRSLLVSPSVGLAGWTILAGVSGGVFSPFVPGFWLEIILSAWTSSSTGTALVTAGAAVALWTQQLLLGGDVPVRALVLQTGFLAAMGGVTFLLTQQWTRSQSESSRRHADLAERLRVLEGEIEALRAVGRVGANVALLAHALTNAVHSLRGFAALIDRGHAGPGRDAEALEGLRSAIDRLEELGRVTLGGARGVALVEGSETRRVIDEAIAEASASYPGVGWRKRIDEHLPAIHADRAILREALVNLTRNAAEAMDGAGEVSVETVVAADRFEIRIRDQGSGLTEDDLRRAEAPGFTTKPRGSGFGLFLTRRFVEAYGGRLTVGPAGDRGTVLSVGLLRESNERP